jgi:hypothetical protein
VRCFFDLVSSHQTITDTEGLELADLEEAHTLALGAVKEMLQQDEAKIAPWLGWRLEARNGPGAVLFAIEIDPALRHSPTPAA